MSRENSYDLRQKDCCGWPLPVEKYEDFYFMKAPTWLEAELNKKDSCCVKATLSWLRIFNSLFILYGVLISAYCVLLLFASTWMPAQFYITNISTQCPDITPRNCTDAQIIFAVDGWDNLREGGAAFWATAGFQGLVAFFLSTLCCKGHLNTVCCSTRTIPILQASAAFYLITFIAVVLLLVMSLIGSMAEYFPHWVERYQIVWLVTLGGDAVGLMIGFILAESFRVKFVAPVAKRKPNEELSYEKRPRWQAPDGYTHTQDGQYARNSQPAPTTDDRYLPNDKQEQQLEMVKVETKQAAAPRKEHVTRQGEGDSFDDDDDDQPVPTWTGKGPQPGAGEINSASWEITPDQIVNGEQIGEGFFGKCFKATWLQQPVVVKRFKKGIRGAGAEAARKNFQREVCILVQLRHPRICQFLGACSDPDDLFLVLEFMENGSLLDYLHKPKNKPLSMSQKIRVMSDVALGLAYLHKCNPAIIHRDLTSGNVLLDDKCHAKVSDFGLSRSYDYRMTLRPGNRFYMAPELLLGRSIYTTAVDIYSLAIIMWETFSGRRPFEDIPASKMKHEVGLNQVRPRLPIPQHLCPPEMQEVIVLSWHHDPTLRPTALTLYSRLQVLEKDAIAAEEASAAEMAQVQAHEAALERQRQAAAYHKPRRHTYGEQPPAPAGEQANLKPPSPVASNFSTTVRRNPYKQKPENPYVSSEEMYVQNSVEQALTALRQQLQSEDGQRMLADEMVSRGLPNAAAAQEALIGVVRQQTEDLARKKFQHAKTQHEEDSPYVINR